MDSDHRNGDGHHWLFDQGGVRKGRDAGDDAGREVRAGRVCDREGEAVMARPRKADVRRNASGRSLGERTEDIVAVGLAARVKAGIALQDALNANAGHTIGRLYLAHIANHSDPFSISAEQKNAADWYSAMIYRNAAIYGLPLPFPKSPQLMFIAPGASCRRMPSDEEIARTRDEHRAARQALLDAGMAIGQGCRVNKIIYEVCIENRDLATMNLTDIGNLRIGLNALAKITRA